MTGARDLTVSAKELAYLFNDLTPRRIQQLAQEGIVVRTGRGRYNLFESTRNYIASTQGANLGVAGLAESAYGDARTQKMRADADRSIMETAQLAQTLIPAEVVEYDWNHMIGAFRQKLLNLPKKTAPLVQHEHTFAKCRNILAEAIHECLAELSDYRPPDDHKANLVAVVSGTSPGPKRKRVGTKRAKTKQRK